MLPFLDLAVPGFRPTAAVVDLAAFARNVRLVARHAGVPVIGVIKADAYGHGALACARVLGEEGAAYAAVALAEEALALREGGISLPLLLLGRAPFAALPDLVRAGVTCTLTSTEDIAAVYAAAAACGRSARVHVKVDTGMGRLGVMPEQAGAFWDLLAQYPLLEVEGVFTHFAAADEAEQTYTRMQADTFADVVALLDARGQRPPVLHCCASSGVHNAPQAYYDMVRPGICLYGGAQPGCHAFTPEPVMQLVSHIAAIRALAAGRAVSYGCTYVCAGARRVAVIPVGYADGWPRALSNKGHVLIGDCLAPILGRVCMDMIMVDVSDVPEAAEYTPVVLFGNPELHGPRCPTINDVAELAGAIPYEIMCGISKRVPRVYA